MAKRNLAAEQAAQLSRNARDKVAAARGPKPGFKRLTADVHTDDYVWLRAQSTGRSIPTYVVMRRIVKQLHDDGEIPSWDKLLDAAEEDLRGIRAKTDDPLDEIRPQT